jgi:hypothetical protein
MSTPSPQQQHINLPKGKAFTLLIDDPHYPHDYPAQLTFSQDKDTLKWTASYSVPSVMLTQMNCQISQPAAMIQFGFELKDVTEDQRKAGYIVGPYIFSFAPPQNANKFSGVLNDPRPDQAEDNWTAEGRPPDPEQGGTQS